MNIYSIADNIISPLGIDTISNLDAISNGKSGITLINDRNLSETEFYAAKIKYDLPLLEGYSFLESLFIQSIKATISDLDLDNERTVLVLSSTKGNIDLLEDEGNSRVLLPKMAQAINGYFSLKKSPILISNACISGVSAILVARNLINMGKADNVIVSGGDVLSKFTLSGFNCLKAVSDAPCKPYDENRTGISLGEGVGTILLSNNINLNKNKSALSEIVGGGQSNDANHISGPSRTGAGLNLAVKKAMIEAKLNSDKIDYINSHGTATLFNDEMESIAFADLNLGQVELNSLKGYFGHTLGAAGIIESILAIHQMNNGLLYKSLGFDIKGVSRDINVLSNNKSKPIRNALKTVSGFGGCNAAVIFTKL
jgi:3-oxoacyl-[acyl-carrier-protein] synthase-1